MAFFTFTNGIMQITVNHLSQLPLGKTQIHRESLIIASLNPFQALGEGGTCQLVDLAVSL